MEDLRGYIARGPAPGEKFVVVLAVGRKSEVNKCKRNLIALFTLVLDKNVFRFYVSVNNVMFFEVYKTLGVIGMGLGTRRSCLISRMLSGSVKWPLLTM